MKKFKKIMVENSKLQGNLTYQFTVYRTVLTLLNDVNITILYIYKSISISRNINHCCFITFLHFCSQSLCCTAFLNCLFIITNSKKVTLEGTLKVLIFHSLN